MTSKQEWGDPTWWRVVNAEHLRQDDDRSAELVRRLGGICLTPCEGMLVELINLRGWRPSDPRLAGALHRFFPDEIAVVEDVVAMHTRLRVTVREALKKGEQ